ncbi:FUSC family protein [Rosenbergiella australiborealis]|uniref:FUSC family protein n=1 Tax=Rosenbergiella australiborealis TaxID=1544696 RepID=UPI001F4E7B0C|nr:FUSC family protein [Rosenbergiella australiborealis]
MHNSLFYRLRFACKTTCALLLALALSFILQLDTPKWSMMTVAIIAASPAFASGGEPMSGVLRFRGFLRLIGTAVGCIGGVVIMILFSRSPVLLLLACCLWAGFFSWLFTIVKQEISYAFGLAGYSVFIILITAWQTPDDVVQIALYRFFEITLGLLCLIFSDLLFLPRSIKRTIDQRVAELPLNCYQLLTQCFTQDEANSFESHFRERLTQAKALQAMRQTLRMESSHYSSMLHRRLKGINGILFHLCTLTYETHQYFQQRPDKYSSHWYLLFQDDVQTVEQLNKKLHQFTFLIHQLPAEQTPYSVSAWLKAMKELRILLRGLHSHQPLHQIEIEIIERYAISTARSAQRKHAFINAVRTFITTASGCILWLVMDPNAISGFLIIASIVTTLAMRAESPKALGLDFVYGMIYILPISMLFYLVILAATQQSFLLLIMALGLVVFILALAVQYKIVGSGASLMFIFNLIPINNPEVFNFSHTLDSGLGQIVGAIVSLVIIAIIPDLHKMHIANALIRNILVTALQTLTTNPQRRKRNHLSALYDQLLQLITLDNRHLVRYQLAINLIIIYRRINAITIHNFPGLTEFHQEIRDCATLLSTSKLALQRERAFLQLQGLLQRYCLEISQLPTPEKLTIVVEDLQQLLEHHKAPLIDG